MGADCAAAWIGAILLSALSYTPAIMAPTEKARAVAGQGARLSVAVCLAAALGSTLTALDVTPPLGGVVGFGVSVLLLVPVGLSAWGAGLAIRAVVRRWLGWQLPYAATLVLGAGSVVFVMASR